jgi:hypothetical protein
MMNQSIKRRWVEALRSGKYKQGYNVLRNRDDTLCCLGVLCEIAVEDGIIGDAVFDGDKDAGYGEYLYGKEEAVTSPPSTVNQWANILDDFYEVHDEEGNEKQLANLNDSGSYTFKMIADLIEKEDSL